MFSAMDITSEANTLELDGIASNDGSYCSDGDNAEAYVEGIRLDQ